MPRSRGGTRGLAFRIRRREAAVDHGILRVRRHVGLHPVTRQARRFTVVELADWVNVVALTPDDRVVLVRQFRHGTETVTLEIPGGTVDPGERPLGAARRELLEETGYAARRWRKLGTLEPNPAIQSNRCHVFLALDATPAAPPSPDDGEVIDVLLRPLRAVPGLLRSGAVSHALVVAAFGQLVAHAGGWRRIPSPPRVPAGPSVPRGRGVTRN